MDEIVAKSRLGGKLAEIWRELALRKETDHEQAALRLLAALALAGWLSLLSAHPSWSFQPPVGSANLAALVAWAYALAAGVQLAACVSCPRTSPLRRAWWLGLDPVFFLALSLCADKAMVPFAFLGVWVPIDNAMRHGRSVIRASLVPFALGFCGLIAMPGYYWSSHVAFGAGLILVAAVCSMYVAGIRKRVLELDQELVSMATRDALTGLPNRGLFMDHLAQAMALSGREGRYCACLFIDLDGFKAVNDGLGHAAGDKLLVEVARRMERCVREGDLVARLGGDEFAIAAQCFDIPSDAWRVAKRVLAQVEAIERVNGELVDVSCSIGVSWHMAGQGPTPSLRPDQLVDRADAAMYEAKRAGKRCVRMLNELGAVHEAPLGSTTDHAASSRKIGGKP